MDRPRQHWQDLDKDVTAHESQAIGNGVAHALRVHAYGRIFVAPTREPYEGQGATDVVLQLSHCLAPAPREARRGEVPLQLWQRIQAVHAARAVPCDTQRVLTAGTI